MEDKMWAVMFAGAWVWVFVACLVWWALEARDEEDGYRAIRLAVVCALCVPGADPYRTADRVVTVYERDTDWEIQVAVDLSQLESPPVNCRGGVA